MSQQDFRINAAVQIVLSRRRANTGGLDFGTTNGVVYLRGTVLGAGPGSSAPAAGRSVLQEIEREIRQVPGVRDVVSHVTGTQQTG